MFVSFCFKRCAYHHGFRSKLGSSKRSFWVSWYLKTTCQVSWGSGAGEEFSQEFVETHRRVVFFECPNNKDSQGKPWLQSGWNTRVMSNPCNTSTYRGYICNPILITGRGPLCMNASHFFGWKISRRLSFRTPVVKSSGKKRRPWKKSTANFGMLETYEPWAK